MLKANDYFEGKVKSIGFDNSHAGEATVGVMAPGEYNFSTGKAEVMTVISGEFKVLLPGETEWQRVSAGSSFDVPANSEFHLQVGEATAYLCRYL